MKAQKAILPALLVLAANVVGEEAIVLEDWSGVLRGRELGGDFAGDVGGDRFAD